MRYGVMHTVGRCRAPFSCGADYAKSYYKNQVGGVIPPYVGTRYQRGGGLGSILGSLGRVAIPLLKKSGSGVAKQALHTGVRLAGDILAGKNAKKAVKARAVESGKELVNKFLKAQQKGSSRTLQVIFPPKKKRKRKSDESGDSKKKKRKRPRNSPPGRSVDIFD